MSALEEWHTVRDAFPNELLTQRIVHLQDTADAAIAELEAEVERLERCLIIWASSLWPMATQEQNERRIAAVKWAEKERTP